jgi:hypothetical protein
VEGKRGERRVQVKTRMGAVEVEVEVKTRMGAEAEADADANQGREGVRQWAMG